MGATIVTAQELSRAVGANGSLSMLDKKLLRYASQGLTLEAMGERLGGILTPAQCGQRVREILKSWDWMAVVERRALILMDMIELKEILLDRVRREGGVVEDSDGRVAYSFGDPRWATNLTNVLKEMNKLISTEQAGVEADRSAIRREHALVMVRAIETLADRLEHGLRQSYPEIQPTEMRAQLEEAVPAAILLIDSAVDEEEREMAEDGDVGF